MSWLIEWEEKAVKELKKLDQSVQREILTYLKKRIATKEDPRRFGKPLGHDTLGLWRYRVGDCRVICHIEDQRLTVLVVRVGHRKDIYL